MRNSRAHIGSGGLVLFRVVTQTLKQKDCQHEDITSHSEQKETTPGSSDGNASFNLPEK